MGRFISRQGADRAESPARSAQAPPNIAVRDRSFQPPSRNRRRLNVEAKSVSLRRKKRYTTNTPRTERAGLAACFSPP
jgi:hypothetical protein